MHTLSRFIAPLLALTTGCASYTSSYVPTADGRARVLWSDTHVYMAPADESEACRAAVGGEMEAPVHLHPRPSGAVVVWWVPVSIVHVHHGPPLLPPPLLAIVYWENLDKYLCANYEFNLPTP